jgi:ATP-dependent DNA helicase RecG
MLSPEELKALAADLESDRVERTTSTTNTDKFREAICAFANDLPGHGKPGYLILGVEDDGRIAGVNATDELLRMLSDRRDDGKIEPIPSMSVYKVDVGPATAVVVVEVQPSTMPPVRANGRVCVRVGPRRGLASREDERRLNERRQARYAEWDGQPSLGSSLAELAVDEVRTSFFPSVVAPDVLAQNNRSIEEQLASSRLFDPRARVPTNGGIVCFGIDPLSFFPGAYIQFVRFDGGAMSDPVTDSRRMTGSLATQLREIDPLVRANIRVARAPEQGLKFADRPDYPLAALRELIFNAVMHRSYEVGNAPVRLLWFSDRIEIQNPGGLYGHVTPQNFGAVPAYRNPVIAGVMHGLGYVDRWGTGVARARAALAANGNPLPAYTFEPSYIQVTVRTAA